MLSLTLVVNAEEKLPEAIKCLKLGEVDIQKQCGVAETAAQIARRGNPELNECSCKLIKSSLFQNCGITDGTRVGDLRFDNLYRNYIIGNLCSKFN